MPPPVLRSRVVKGAAGNVSRDGLGSSLKQTWNVWALPPKDPDDSDYFQILWDKLIADCPATLLGLARSDIAYQEDANGSRVWSFDVSYSAYTPLESQIRWSFDTTGGNIKIFTSKATTAYGITGRPAAPNHNGAIGVKGREVEGVEVVTPVLRLTANYRHLQSSATVNDSTIDAYIKLLAGMTGTTNDATWMTYAQGELLFLGASGEYVPGKDTEIQYHFAASKNATSLSIGSIVVGTKRGHDYVWIGFEAVEDSSAICQRPRFAYVERVYSESNFNDFGL